jgi:hypothetical protein
MYLQKVTSKKTSNQNFVAPQHWQEQKNIKETMVDLTYVEDSNLFVRNGNIGGVLSGHREGLRLVEGQHFREGYSVVAANRE